MIIGVIEAWVGDFLVLQISLILMVIIHFNFLNGVCNFRNFWAAGRYDY